MEEYRIDTIEQLINAARGNNLAMLMYDLEAFVSMHLNMDETPGVEMSTTFRWVNDGETGLKSARVTIVE